MPWLAVAAAVAAGLAQAAGVGLWGQSPLLSLPAVALVAQLPLGDRRRLLAVALAAGLAWDAAGGSVGTGTFATLAAAAAADFASYRWLPPRGATAVGALAAVSCLVIRTVQFAAAGFTGFSAPAWIGQALVTAVAAGLLYRVSSRSYGR